MFYHLKSGSFLTLLGAALALGCTSSDALPLGGFHMLKKVHSTNSLTLKVMSTDAR